jgi:hypothetical protein
MKNGHSFLFSILLLTANLSTNASVNVSQMNGVAENVTTSSSGQSAANLNAKQNSPDAIKFDQSYKAVWSLCDQCSNPESVYYDAQSKNLFISNVAGASDQKDGQGWIQKVSSSGKVVSSKWVVGLNAPKGMRAYKGVLWVSDIDEIVSINIRTGQILKKYPVPDATFLNDIAIDKNGVVYVSDTFGLKIYQLKNNKVSQFAFGEVVDSPNGLLVVNGYLYVASWGLAQKDWSTKVPGQIFKISIQTKEKKFVTKAPLGNLDGLEVDNKGNFIVSDWMAGKVYQVSPEGDVIELFHGIKGAADIGYDPKSEMLFIPRMGEDMITAFNLKMHPDLKSNQSFSEK